MEIILLKIVVCDRGVLLRGGIYLVRTCLVGLDVNTVLEVKTFTLFEIGCWMLDVGCWM